MFPSHSSSCLKLYKACGPYEFIVDIIVIPVNRKYPPTQHFIDLGVTPPSTFKVYVKNGSVKLNFTLKAKHKHYDPNKVLPSSTLRSLNLKHK